MNELQYLELEKLVNEFETNRGQYENWGSREICSFSVFESKDENEYVVVVGINKIVGIDDSDAGVNTSLRYYALLPNGGKIDLLSSFKNDTNKVYDYLQKLNKII